MIHSNVCVISEDTDVFALLYYFYHKLALSGGLMIQPAVKGRDCHDIVATVKKNAAIIPNILDLHAI